MEDINSNETQNESSQKSSGGSNSERESWLKRLVSFFYRNQLEEVEGDDMIKNDNTLFSMVRDRYINKKHCPYCFSYVSKRIYLEQSRSTKNITSGGIPLHLAKMKIPVCPSCKKKLPSDFFNSQSTSIALIGGKEAGKSSYITVFCELLLHQKSILNELGLFGSILNEEGIEQFDFNREILISQQTALPGTTRTEEPIIVRLQSKHHSKVLYITLIDQPGEDFENLDRLITNYPNLQLADGIIFLMNPLDVSGILELLEEENPGTAPTPHSRVSIENFNIIQKLYDLYTMNWSSKTKKGN